MLQWQAVEGISSGLCRVRRGRNQSRRGCNVMDDQSDVAGNHTVAASVGDSDGVSSVVIEGEERCWDSCNRFRGYCVENIVLGELRVSYISWRNALGCMRICSV